MSKIKKAKAKGWNFIEHSISLEHCKSIASNVMKCAHDIQTMPLCVAICDNGGHLKYFERMDGCGIMRQEIAYAKAYTCLSMGFASRDLTKNLSNRPSFLQSLSVASQGRMAFAAGGVLLLQDGKVVGAVGISGDTSLVDEFCAIKGAQDSGFDTSPSQAHPDFLKSSL